MAVNTAGRVSKGVFVMKGTQKTINIEKLCLGPEENLDAERLQLCDDLLEKASENIQLMQSELNTKIFDDLVGYIDKQHKDFVIGEQIANEVDRRRPRLPEIPTAALVTGINTSDHGVMFNNLLTLLKQRVTSYVAVLKSKDCGNLRSIMNTSVAQVMDSTDVVDEDDDGEVHSHTNRRISGTLTVLKNWYHEMNKQRNSPPKSPSKRRSNGSPKKEVISPKAKHSPPIVFVVEDLESFTPSVLQDFITICSRHVQDLPIVFVFGIATTVTTIHKILPQHISSVLCIEKFQAPPSTDYLAQVVRQIVMAPETPFKLGGKAFNVLLDLFLYHDFSVLRFIQGYEAALLDHFHSNRASVLCVAQEDVDAQVASLSSDKLDDLRSIRSFRTYVENRPPAEQIKLLEDDEHAKAVIIKVMQNLHEYNQCLIPIVTCLHCFTAKLPGQPLGTRLREVYAMVMNLNLCDAPEYAEAISLLHALSRDEMVQKLGECCSIMSQTFCNENLAMERNKIQELKDKFQNLDQLMQESTEEPEEPEPQVPPTDQKPLPQKFHELKEKLMCMDKKKKKLTVYEVVRNETIDSLGALFKKYLINPMMFPLHEVLYYNSASFIKRHIIGKPRSVLESALSTPHHYLQREDLMGDGSAILPTLPDLCIVFKLHQECGRLINLYDWLQAFVTIVKAGIDNDENINDQQNIDKILQARFIRAVSELEFLGFVKSTKRKTDHVARLTWGAC